MHGAKLARFRNHRRNVQADFLRAGIQSGTVAEVHQAT
jgi:hypothetical protein